MKHTFFKRVMALLAALMLLVALAPAALALGTITVYEDEHPVTEGGNYSSMEEVAVYLARFGELPDNYITKKEADALGWKTKGDLDEVAPGCSIGGDHFGNYEGILPVKKGLKYTECDIDYKSGSRNAKRLILSSEGRMYYTDDHYTSFNEVNVVKGGAEAGGAEAGDAEAGGKQSGGAEISEDGEYYTAEDVAAYINAYGKLPRNYITKKQAKELGWTAKKDNLAKLAPGCVIGGDSFGNREGLLPDKKGRKWHECDVNVKDGKRGGERLVYSTDGLIYYSGDGYKSFEKLY